MPTIKPDVQEQYAEYVAVNSDGGYAQAVIDYGKRWMDLMEAALASGDKLENIVTSLSHKADTDGITGYQNGAAASAIAHFWIHGEEFRKIYNRSYGVEAAEGTVNPAIVTINA